MKEINFNQEINEDSYLSFIEDLNHLDLEEGGEVVIKYDSIGGDVCWAKKMARAIQDLKNKNIRVVSINDGKVYSSAVIPFNYGSVRRVNSDKNSGFLVHKIKMPHEGVELSNIDKIKSDLEKYTEELEDIYRATGVSEEAIKHLSRGNDLLVTDFNKMLEFGLADEIIGENKMNLISSVKNLWKNPRKEAKFSFKNKFEESEDLLNKKQIQTQNKKAMDEEMKNFMNGISTAINKQVEMMGNLDERIRGMEEKYNTMSKMTPSHNVDLSEEDMVNLRNIFSKTSVLNHGKIKNVLHLKNRCNEGDWMMPMNEKFEYEEEEKIEDEYLNLANGGKFFNSKKKVINKDSDVNKINNSAELINSITSEDAPITKAQNVGSVSTKSTYDASEIYKAAIKYGGGKYGRGEHKFTI